MNAETVKLFPCLTVFMATKYQQIPCQKIISGGQTGVDQGALDACLESGFPCGGWIPAGRKTENGYLSTRYPLKETQEAVYEIRTNMNVKDSDGTCIFAQGELAGGTQYTAACAKALQRPLLILFPVNDNYTKLVAQLSDWIATHNIGILNVAGPRKSEWTEGYKHSYATILQLINRINSR